MVTLNGDNEININVHASLTSNMQLYGLAVSRSCNECDIVKLDKYYLCDVCCLLAFPDNARLTPELINFVEDVDLNFTCRGGMLSLTLYGSHGTMLTSTADDCHWHCFERQIFCIVPLGACLAIACCGRNTKLNSDQEKLHFDGDSVYCWYISFMQLISRLYVCRTLFICFKYNEKISKSFIYQKQIQRLEVK